MSVLIKGMEMPISCEDCYISNCPNDIGYTDKGRRTRSFYCPLVSVPPHGRLIDADALKVKAIKRSGKCGGYVNVLDKVITAHDIEIAPTIIEAEDGEP